MEIEKTINEEIRQRILELLKESNQNPTSLARQTGLPQRNLDNQISGRNNTKYSVYILRGLIGYYEKINPLWILFGDPYRKNLINPYEITEEDIPGAGEKRGEYGQQPKEEEEKDIIQDLLDLKGIAELKKNEKIITSRTNFYAPVIPAGSYVYLTQVTDWKKFVEFGRIYYIELKDNRELFAFIEAGEESGHFTLQPLNRQSVPMSLPVDLIKKIWLARRKIEEL